LEVIHNSRSFVGRYVIFRILKFVVTFAVLTLLAITASSQVHADEGRIHITFFKGESGSGSGIFSFKVKSTA
jgi:hypothetical protein